MMIPSFRHGPIRQAALAPPAIESPSLETVRPVKAIIAGDVPAGAFNADHWSGARRSNRKDSSCVVTQRQRFFHLIGRHSEGGVSNNSNRRQPHTSLV
jgi:hypothetical protein